jgi:hypothetical protein
MQPGRLSWILIDNQLRDMIVPGGGIPGYQFRCSGEKFPCSAKKFLWFKAKNSAAPRLAEFTRNHLHIVSYSTPSSCFPLKTAKFRRDQGNPAGACRSRRGGSFCPSGKS